jgi:hypothetical protein
MPERAAAAQAAQINVFRQGVIAAAARGGGAMRKGGVRVQFARKRRISRRFF